MRAPERLLVVAAHPDDETLGAAALMARARHCHVLHLTDGAPRERSFALAGRRQPRSLYAAIRRREVLQALALIGLAEQDVESLGITAHDAVFHLAALSHAVASTIRSYAPSLVVTHAYEGGHPDHDAAAFAVWAATRLLNGRAQTAPRRVEMALYHGAHGEFTAGRFLTSNEVGSRVACSEVERLMTGEEQERKRAMLRCFVSQRAVLAPFFGLPSERYRIAPEYDFARAPHGGQLLYERTGLPLESERWRQLARSAVRELKL